MNSTNDRPEEAAVAAMPVPSKMRAFTRTRYGTPDVLGLVELETPEPSDGQVLVRVHASSVNPYEWHTLTGTPYVARLTDGLRAPKNPRIGGDVAGTVAAVGSSVTAVSPGDAVFGVAHGAYGEYTLARADRIVAKPENVSFEAAAAVPLAAVTALQGLRDKGQIEAGRRVLINGASGGIGTQAVQIAKAYGATVTGVCSTRNVEMVRSLGTDEVVDYTTEDYTTAKYDLILDTVGNRTMRDIRRALVDDGRYVMVGVPKEGNWIGPLIHPLKAIILTRLWSQTLSPMLTSYTEEDLVEIQRLLASGDLKPVIGARYSLEETPDALRHQGAGHAQGKTVINVLPETAS